MGYVKNISSSFITRIIKIILGFGISIIVARALGAEGQGYVAYILLIGSLLAGYGHLGIINATTYFFKRRPDYSQEEVYSVSLSFSILVWIVIMFFVLFMRYLGFILLNYNILMVSGLLIYVLIVYLETLSRKFHRSENKIIKMNKFLLVNTVVQFILVVIFWKLDHLTPVTYFSIIITGLSLSTFLLVCNMGLKYSFKLNKKLLKDEFKYGSIVYFATLFIFLNYRADQFLIRNMIGTSALGVYSIGVKLAELVLLLPSSVATALSGELYSISSESKKRKFITATTIKYTFYFCLIIALIGFFMTPLIPLLYGREFIESISVFRILLVGVCFVSIGKASNPYFYTQGTPEKYLIIVLVTFFINIVLNLMLIPHMGIDGAAWASTIAYLFYGLMHIFYFIVKENILFERLFLINKLEIEKIKGLLSQFSFF
ncbi:polysaccharide biosynthesis C-terminal domain-containing protein [Natroniella sp. ANB-PHB2]|uniref:oligosaccharide flippase family protein n=1 Tax=Natroniella sp. ANB-PHB2 TaxID=3384444 RepID=UPI0038D50CAF